MHKKRIYGHQELAQLYFPDVLPKSASSQLTRWIARDEDLSEALHRAGHRKRTRLYTPLQVDILFEHLGEPERWNG